MFAQVYALRIKLAIPKKSCKILPAGMVVYIMQNKTFRNFLAQKNMAHSEYFYRSVFEHSMEAVFFTAPDGSIFAANPAACELLGRTEEEICRVGRAGVVDSSSPQLGSLLDERARTGKARGELIFLRGNGTRFSAEVSSAIFLDEGGQERTVLIVRDLTERKQAQARISKLARLYDTLSKINTTIVHSANQEELFRNICRSVVEQGKFVMAWVGLVDEAAHLVRPVYYDGAEQGYLKDIVISTDDVPEGRGPTGTAVRENRVCFVNSFLTDERTKPWVEPGAKRGFRSSVGLPLRLKGKVIGALTVYAGEPDFFDVEQVALMEEMSADMSFALDNIEHEAERKQAEQKIAEYVKRLEGTMQNTLQAVANMVEFRDPYTAGHERRVGLIACAIAREMGWLEDKCHGLQLIGLVHDIGKIAVPAEILTKPGRLTQLEFKIVQTHSEKGYEILKDVDFPLPIAEIIYQHHERMDGSGYPRGLKGEEILAEARILAVSDVLESMSSHRPYRPALGVEAALKEIEDHRGVWFDGEVADAMLRLVRNKGYQLPA